jgi:hypothetical protein
LFALLEAFLTIWDAGPAVKTIKSEIVPLLLEQPGLQEREIGGGTAVRELACWLKGATGSAVGIGTVADPKDAHGDDAGLFFEAGR